MQVLPREQSFGSELGTGLGQLAGLKLGQLVKRHEQAKERSHFAQTWEPILGKDSANFLSNLQPEERKHALQNISALVQLNQPPSSQEQAENLGQKNGLGVIAQPQQQQISPERAQLVENLFASPQERRDREKLELAKRTAVLKETKPYIDSLKNLEKGAKESNLRLKRMKTLIENGQLPNANVWSTLTKIEESPLHLAGAGAILGGAAGTALLPGLGTGVGAAIGTGLGSVIGGLISPFAGAAKSWIKSGTPDIEEFEKLSADFVKNAKQFFGPRLTNADLQVFMKTLPTLMQTDAGKKKVIENLSSLNELAEIEAKAARSIIKANHGIPPLDIEQQVKDKISKKVDQVAKKFISG